MLQLLTERPQLKFILVDNIDTMDVNIDPGILGRHIQRKAGMTVEVITRRPEDRGGGLARSDGHLRLIEGLAMPREKTSSIFRTITPPRT